MSVPVTCARCVMDDTVPDLRLDATGVCHLCHVHDRLERAHRIGGDPQRLARFREMVVRIKKSGVRQEHDCVVPLSGGADSSYTLWTAVRLGLDRAAFEDMLAAPPRGPADFDTFRPAIRRLGPLIRVLTRRGFLSEHVYDKFFEC